MQLDVQNDQPRATAQYDRANQPDVNLQLEHLKLNAAIPYFAQIHTDPYVTTFSLDFSDHATKIRTNSPADLIDIASITLGSLDGLSNSFGGCMKVVRFNGEYLNLTALPENNDMASENNMITENANGGIIPYHDRQGVSMGCSQIATCKDLGPSYCPSGMICKDLWKGPICSCPSGGTALLDADGKLSHCNEIAAVSSLGISSPAVILIIACLAVLICEFLLSQELFLNN